MEPPKQHTRRCAEGGNNCEPKLREGCHPQTEQRLRNPALSPSWTRKPKPARLPGTEPREETLEQPQQRYHEG